MTIRRGANTSRRKRHVAKKEEKMLQNINVLVKAPETTGNTKLDLEAQQRFNRQLLRALEYLLEQIDRKLEEGKQ